MNEAALATVPVTLEPPIDGEVLPPAPRKRPKSERLKDTAAWAALTPELWDVARLLPSAQNARLHSPKQVKAIAESMKQFGFTIPVLVDEAGDIIAGHGRLLAAQLLKLAQVPVIIARGWTEEEKRAYRLMDNQLTISGEWDDEKLKIELSDLQDADFDVSLIGFSDEELAKILKAGTEGNTDPDATPETPEEPVSERGDVWLLGRHRIVCGDSTSADDVAKVLNGVKPHLMVTDPPYGVEYDPGWRAKAGINKNTAKMGVVLNDDRADWTEAWSLFPGDVAYVWHGGLHTVTVLQSLERAGFTVRSQIIWAKDRFALSRGDYHWQHEPAWYVVKTKATGHWAGDRKQSTVWNIPARDDSGVGHGTQKPVECMKRPMENNSSPGQAVYEPFSGSGTTIIAGEMTGRCVHAVELNPAYVDVAVTRWQDFAGDVARLEETGETFIEVMARRRPGAKVKAQVADKKPITRKKNRPGARTSAEESEALR